MLKRKLTDDACKKIIRMLASKYKINPRLIVTRLISEDDKNDMRSGNLPIEALETHIKIWIKNGMPDYVNGTTEPLASEE